MALAGGPTATSARAAATSSAASGCMGASGTRTAPPSAPDWAIPPRNSKNCVARTIVYGTLPPSISLSWATLARRYPLSGIRSAPTTDSATWCPTPAAASAGRRLRADVSKNSSTALSSNEGEFDTSTTTWAPARAPASPSPVSVLTPDEGDADTASWPRWRSRGINFLPMSPLPPITTIFMLTLHVRRLSIAPAPVGSRPPLAHRRRSLLLLFRDDDVLDVVRVQHHGQDARLALLARVFRHPVQAAARFVEGVPGLERFDGLVVDGPLVL